MISKLANLIILLILFLSNVFSLSASEQDVTKLQYPPIIKEATKDAPSGVEFNALRKSDFLSNNNKEITILQQEKKKTIDGNGVSERVFSVDHDHDRQKRLKELDKLKEAKEKEKKKQEEPIVITKDSEVQQQEKNEAVKITNNPTKVQTKTESDFSLDTTLYDISPGYIYSSKFGKNSHLPDFLYRKNYEEIFFENVRTDNISALYTILRTLKTTEIRNKSGDTPLIYAARLGKISALRLLLMNNADICAKNYQGKTAYQLARNQQIRTAIEAVIFRARNDSK